MGWAFPDGKPYRGPVHVLRDVTYSGATRTRESRRLIEIPSPSKQKPAVKREARPKREPVRRRKGATAWD